MSEAICEVAVLFKDSEQPSIIKEREIIEKSPVLMKAIEGENPDWKTTDIKINTPLDIPFPKAAGEFVFDNLLKYTPPAEMDFEKKPDDYPEANAKSVDELKPILELASYMECEGFMRCIGFVVGKKLSEMPVDTIAAYLGVEMISEEELLAQEDGWLHPPAALFDN
ncbi:hypothetical protein GCK72_008399 [Caenorhabditis remanei]|uniref:SKP1 component dimerisation domain-containing protein n=1 Tax=Caenorhabditis remanei TaxID=31234 RepID=A0A6A5H0H5_CAERE|nr:hypothetical protein GCK72_008399 [Caenorhabditis remanei]KAF1760153.1 hypothetical protein GCK72_008399 [Caenorhabditis remanei]